MAEDLFRGYGVPKSLGARGQEQADARDAAIAQRLEVEGDRAWACAEELAQIVSQVRLGENGGGLDGLEELVTWRVRF